MTETLYQKGKTKKIIQVNLYAFNNTRDRPILNTEKKVDRLIEIQLNKHGWYKLKW